MGTFAPSSLEFQYYVVSTQQRNVENIKLSHALLKTVSFSDELVSYISIAEAGLNLETELSIGNLLSKQLRTMKLIRLQMLRLV